jgi:hypothetical protein
MTWEIYIIVSLIVFLVAFAVSGVRGPRGVRYDD